MGMEIDPNKALEAGAHILEKVPIYQDALQSSAKEIGKGLETVTKTVLLPIRALKAVVWGVDQIEAYLERSLGAKLKNVPEENLQSPPISVAGPIVEAMRFHSEEPGIADMFANLLANAMDSRTAELGHPGYIEIIKQITPDEAKILRYMASIFAFRPAFPIIDVCKKDLVPVAGEHIILRLVSTLGKIAGCTYPQHTPKYLDNFARLGIIELPAGVHYTAQGVYAEVESLPEVVALLESLNAPGISMGVIKQRVLYITTFGIGFLQACVLPKV